MLPPLVRTSLPIELACTSTKVSSGPATIALLCRSTALPFKGWLSDVIQMAVTPLIPEGTMHWSIGRLIEKGRPPVIIWQLKPEVLPLRAGELNCNEVPTLMLPVVVTERAALAFTPRSQPEMKAPAMASTSWGSRGMSKA